MPPRQRRIPPGYEINPATGRVRKSCRANQVRSPETGRCRKIRTPVRVRSIPIGYEINPETGRLRKSCRANQVRSPLTGRCIKEETYIRLFVASPRRRNPRRQARPRSPIRRSRSRSRASSQASQECCVCYDKTRRSIRNCKHLICKKCYRGMRQTGRTMACPMCRGRLSRTPSPKRR